MRFGCDVCDGQVQVALVLGVDVPLGDPEIEVLQLVPQGFEGGGGADDAQDGEEDVVAYVVCGGQDVEDCGQD